MELAFSTLSVRKVCEDESEARKKLGVSVAGTLVSRIADLRALDYVSDLFDLSIGNPRRIAGMPRKSLIIDLCDNYYLSFCANHTSFSSINEKINWDKVRRIKIMKVGVSIDG